MKAAGKNHGERTHAVLSPSGADRWLNCTPSARLGEKYPNESNEYADEGTLAHEIAETVLLHSVKRINGDELKKRLKVHANNPLYYVGIIGDVQPYVDQILEQIATDKNAELHIEGKFSYAEYVQNGSGLCDSTVIAKGILYITDLKFGKGIRVVAENNSQLKLYGLGALMQFDMVHDIHTVRLTIVQPRLDSVSVWDITPADLYKWAEQEVKPKAKLAFKGEGELKTGDWCKFCKAKVNCTALKSEALSFAKNDFNNDREYADAAGADEDWMLDVYHKADRITDYLSAVKAHVYDRALKGFKWEGLKLVEGKSNRSITNEKMARHILIKSGYKFDQFENSKLKGIGDLEKLMGKDVFNKLLGNYIDKPKGKPTLVDESDPRPVFSSADDFKDELNTNDLL